METLRMHMKTVHNESEDEKILRVAQTVESALKKKVSFEANSTSLDCTECGLCFATKEAHTSHFNENHSSFVKNHNKMEHDTNGLVNEGYDYGLSVKSITPEVLVKSEFYDVKSYPDNKSESEDDEVDRIYGKKAEQNQMGITMKEKIWCSNQNLLKARF